MDSNIPISAELIADSDAHLFAALLKSYLRELPIPFLGGKDSTVYHKWLHAATLASTQERVDEIRNIINSFSVDITLNIQYLVKFLSELSSKAEETKMTPHNIAICLGPTILWNDRSSLTEQGHIERIIAIVGTFVESYTEIFPKDLDWKDYEDAEVEQLFSDSIEFQNKETDNSFQYRNNKKGNDNANRQSKELSVNGNLTTTTSRTSVVVDTTQAPIVNITSSTTTITSQPSKSVSESSPSPNRQRRSYGASFKTKFLSKMQNINSPLSSKTIEERDDEADEKRSME